ncbi:MAG: LIM domain-containing protein [Elusimicrobiota bacterium]
MKFNKIPVVILALIFFTCTLYAAAEINCNLCGKIIYGQYFNLKDGRTTCPACFNNLPRCMSCANIITGKYWVVESGEKYCDECYQHKQKCRLCGNLFDNGYVVEDNPVCEKCYQKTEKCASCGIALVTRWWTYDNSGKSYCIKCHKSNNKCDVCGNPVGKTYLLLPDDRLICEICNRTAVKDSIKVDQLLARTSKYIRVTLGLYVDHLPKVELVDKNKMGTIGNGVESGDKADLLGLFQKKGRKYKIYLLENLPQALAVGVLAHEYAHAWQYANCPKDQRLVLTEGFAEWVLYKALLNFGFKNEAAQITKRTDLYGQGFIIMRNIEETDGMSGVIQKMRTMK